MITVIMNLTMFLPLLLAFGSMTDVFAYYLADLTIPTILHEQSAEYTYENCLSMNKILYEDRCWDLLTKGPCDEGQWLVLEKSADGDETAEPLRAKCTRRRCSESDVYWPRDGFCHDEETARRDGLCDRAGTVLATDEFGDGRCKCRDGGKVPYARVVTADDDGDQDSQRPCYPLYSRGPCPRDRVLTANHGTRYGVCTVDECTEERRLQSDSSSRRQPPAPSLAPWTDGQCYALGTRGPCTGHEQFIVVRDTMRPNCVRLSVELTVLPNATGRPGCETDHRGNCVAGVEVSTAADALRDALLKNAMRYSARNKAQIKQAGLHEVRRHKQSLQWQSPRKM